MTKKTANLVVAGPRQLLAGALLMAFLACNTAPETGRPDAGSSGHAGTDASTPDARSDPSLDAAARDAANDAATDATTADVGRDAAFIDAAIIDAASADASLPGDARPILDAHGQPDAEPSRDAGAPSPDAAPFDTGPVCAPVPEPPPDPDPWSVTLPAVAAPVTRSVNTGGHSDLYLSGPGGVAELGVRLDWGGSVVFFGQTGIPASNVIDANDTGRELQIALYDPDRSAQGCAYNASCRSGTPCETSITFLGWDPVQGGDECEHGARILSSGVQGDAMVVEVRPLQWNPDWNAPDCRKSACGSSGVEVAVTYRLAFKFVHSNVVEVSMTVASDEAIDHASTAQEFPTLYVGHGGPSTDLPLLLDSEGTAISIDVPANDGFTMKNFVSPAPWVTWQHTVRDYGVGLLTDNSVRDFQGWSGDGQQAPYFHNVRPIQSFGLPARGVVRGRAYMTLGSFATVRSLMQQVLATRPPFGVLDSPAQGSVATSGQLQLQGWVLDNRSGTTVRARLDGHDLPATSRTTSRGDVCVVYPNYPGCPMVGFELDLAVPAAPCPRLLEVIARDSDGNESILARRRVR